MSQPLKLTLRQRIQRERGQVKPVRLAGNLIVGIFYLLGFALAIIWWLCYEVAIKWTLAAVRVGWRDARLRTRL